MSSNIRQQSIHGIAWSTIGKFSNLFIQFIISIILARILTPEDYGIIGVLTIFFALATTCVDSGFTSALIQKKNFQDIDASTVFYFNIVIGIIVYATLYWCAPWIAVFFKLPILISVTRIAGLTVPIGAFSAVQQALFRKRVEFKTISIVSVISTLLSGVIGVVLAYKGSGVWALVYQQIIAVILSTILLWIFSTWRPKLEFSMTSFKEMFSYGIKLLGANILGIFYFHGEKLAIGKYYTADSLGYYTKGTTLASQGSTTITQILSAVTFPVLATIQDDISRLLNVYKIYIKLSSLVIFFLMLLIVALGKPIILLLYTAKWSGAIIYLQIICFSLMFDHISSINLNLYYVRGRSDLVLKLEVVKRIISIFILVISIPFGVIGICISRVIYSQIAIFINIYYTGKLFNYGYIQQWKDFGKYLLFGFISNIPTFFIHYLNIHNIFQILIGILLSITIYVLILKATKDFIYSKYVLVEIKNFKKKILKYDR